MSASAVLIIRIKKIFKYMKERNAISSEKAIPVSEIPHSNRWFFKRLVKLNVVKKFNELYYLDVEAAQLYLQTRRKYALILLILVLVLIALFLTNQSV